MQDCLFCKIAAGQVSSYKVYQDKDFFAFLAVPPLNPGHTLIIPKKHFRWVWDLSVDQQERPNICQYYQLVSKIANALRNVYQTKWIISLIIGEEVPHAHISLIPRFKEDGHGGSINFRNIKKLTEIEMREAAEKIMKRINKL